MDDKLKQRLVGAAVLVALAVTFVPMLLESHRPQEDFERRFGRAPAPETDYLAPVPAFEPVEAPEVMVVDETTPVAVDAPDTAGPARHDADAVPAVTPASAPPVAADRPEPSVAERPGGWAVQLGSFRARANAMKLRDRARAAGFTAYVEDIGSGAAARYRVRVGPEARRERAQATLARVRQRLGIDGLLVRH